MYLFLSVATHRICLPDEKLWHVKTSSENGRVEWLRKQFPGIPVNFGAVLRVLGELCFTRFRAMFEWLWCWGIFFRVVSRWCSGRKFTRMIPVESACLFESETDTRWFCSSAQWLFLLFGHSTVFSLTVNTQRENIPSPGQRVCMFSDIHGTK